MFPRRIVPLTLLAAVAVAPATVADAKPRHTSRSTQGFAVPCLKADGQTWRYASKPRSCTQADDGTLERSLVPVKSIRWKTWTRTRAKGSGKVKARVDGGYTGPVVLTGSAPKRCSSKRTIFTRVTVSIPKLGAIANQRVACPE